MRRSAAVVFASVLVFSAAGIVSADIIAPTEVRATSQFGLGVIVVDSLIDGSGLDGAGPIASQLHDNDDDNMWFSGCEDAGIAGGTPAECPTGFEVPPVDEQIVEFVFDTAYDLGSALVWQYNEFNDTVGPLAERGVKRLEMLVSPSLEGEFTAIGEFELALASPGDEAGAFTAPVQSLDVCDLPATDSVRRVRFHLLEAHSGGEADYVGLSEVRFEGVEAANVELITPSGITGTSQFGLGIVTDNLINGSGLDGEGAVEDQLHTNDNATMWFSGCEDAGLPGGTPPECPTGFEVAPVDEQVVEFEFDGSYDLSSALVWQYNERSGIGPLPGRGVRTFEMLASPNLTDDFVSLGTYELAVASPAAELGVFSEPAQKIGICGPESTGVQRVRFRILEAHSGEAMDYVGLSEVRFQGTPLIPSVGQLAGDANQDGDVNVSDIITGIKLLFPTFFLLDRSPASPPCATDAGNVAVLDVNGDAALSAADLLYLAQYLFGGGPAPVGGVCIRVPEADCDENAACSGG